MDLRPGTVELLRAGALPPAPGGPEGSRDLLSGFHAVRRSTVQDCLHALQASSPEHCDLGDKTRLADFLIDAESAECAADLFCAITAPLIFCSVCRAETACCNGVKSYDSIPSHLILSSVSEAV